MKGGTVRQKAWSIAAATRMSVLVDGCANENVVTWPGMDFGISVWVWEEGGDTTLELIGPGVRKHNCTGNTAHELLPAMAVELLGQMLSGDRHMVVRTLLRDSGVLRDLIAKTLPNMLSDGMRRLNYINVRLSELQIEASATMSQVTELYSLGQHRIGAERVP